MIKRILCNLILMACAFVLAIAALAAVVEWTHGGDHVALVLAAMFGIVALGSATGAVLVLSQE